MINWKIDLEFEIFHKNLTGKVIGLSKRALFISYTLSHTYIFTKNQGKHNDFKVRICDFT